MEHDEVIGRLRAMGGHPIEGSVAARHLETAAHAEADRFRRGLSIAAACLIVAGVPAAAIAASRAGVGDSDFVALEQPSEGHLTAPCANRASHAGPPVPDDESRTPAPADHLARLLADCPGDSTTTSSTTTASSTTTVGDPTTTTVTTLTSVPTAGASATHDITTTTNADPAAGIGQPPDDCTGPPPFAAVPASTDDPHDEPGPSQRASEAAAHAQGRSACLAGTTPTSVPVTEPPAAHAPTSAMPPSGNGNGNGNGNESGSPGRPGNVPAGRGDDAPGPPEHAQGGRPDGVPGRGNAVTAGTASSGQEPRPDASGGRPDDDAEQRGGPAG